MNERYFIKKIKAGKKPKQKEFEFGKKFGKGEEKMQDWRIFVKKTDYILKDRFDEFPDIELQFKNGKFYIDEEEVSVEEFWEVLGKGKNKLHTERPDIENIIRKELYYENLRKKTGEKIGEIENEKMQQSLNKK